MAIYRIVVSPFTWLYLALVKLRLALFRLGIYKQHQLDQPVICIGNLVAGGTGKTPFVLYLCRWLIEQGYAPAILTRGYRSGLASDDTAVLLAGEWLMRRSGASDALHADEAMLQSVHLPNVPVVVGADRYRSARYYLSLKPAPDVWIMDDGFQHRSLKRDLDILLLGKLQSSERFQVFPAGCYREPLSHADRAQLIFVDDSSDQETVIEAVKELAERPLYRYMVEAQSIKQVTGTNMPLKSGQTVQLLCAIANPERFASSASQLGFQISARHFLPDHQVISHSYMTRLERDNTPILITEKDFFRQKSFWMQQKRPIYVLEISLRFNEPTKANLHAKLSAVLK